MKFDSQDKIYNLDVGSQVIQNPDLTKKFVWTGKLHPVAEIGLSTVNYWNSAK